MKNTLLIALICWVGSHSFATSFFIVPFSDFTRSTTHIVRGIVRDVRVENGLTDDGGKTIYTLARIEVKEVIKGKIEKSEIVVRKVGGTKDGVTIEIPSSVEFSENEETVLFLGPERADSAKGSTYEVFNLQLDKFGLKQVNDQSVLTGGLFALNSTAESHEAAAGSIPKENLQPWNLTQLKNLVQTQERTSSGPNASSQTAASPGTNGGSNSTMNSTPTGTTIIRGSNDESSVHSMGPEATTANGRGRAYQIFGALALLAIIAGFFLFRRK